MKILNIFVKILKSNFNCDIYYTMIYSYKFINKVLFEKDLKNSNSSSFKSINNHLTIYRYKVKYNYKLLL